MHPAGVPAPLAHALSALSQWLRTGLAGSPPPLERDALAGAAADNWHAQLLTAASSQLAQVGALCSDCAALQHGIGDRPDRPLPKLSETAAAAMPARGAHHHDHGMLLFGAVSTGLSVFCAGLLWIFSGWQDGAGAVAVAAIACCFFATIDEPRPVARSFLRWSAVCLVVASFYLFLVVPHAQSFETLAGMLAVPYLGIGMLIARPAQPDPGSSDLRDRRAGRLHHRPRRTCHTPQSTTHTRYEESSARAGPQPQRYSRRPAH